MELTEKEIIESALGHMAEALCFAYECQTDEGKAFAWMLDSAIKYGQVISRGDDVLDANNDYAAYEQKVYEQFIKNNEIKIKKAAQSCG